MRPAVGEPLSTTSGPDFVSFQVRDRAASAAFYTELVGMQPIPVPNPHASAFSASGTTFALRDPFPGMDLDASGPLGTGIAVWFHNPDASTVHGRLVDAGVRIVTEPFDGPFGITFAFADPDGYVVTLHSRP
ncbi:VOC family protein [Xylanimonas sp. McL0601]|uniref:VOC family protein n=1 Tax=Xylanimonas sp. McL0601 TaxID=3414739 RepID=UPI003CF138B4